jgi:uncharacterized protein (UPF0303 family)
MARPQPDYTIDQLESEPRVELPSFTRDDAARLGEIAMGVIREWGLDLAVDIHIGDELAFRAQFGSTGQGNADTIEGKRLTAQQFGSSSMLAALRKKADPSVGEGLDDRYKFWGGCIPIFVGGRLAATISTSGEPDDRIDHAAGEEALRRFLAERSS